jgi:hypothetical protein
MGRRRRKLLFGGDPVAAAEEVIAGFEPLFWAKINEGTGTTITDHGSAGEDAIFASDSAAPTWVSTGISCDGGDFAATANPVNPSGDALTVMAVVNNGAGSGTLQGIVFNGDVAGNQFQFHMSFGGASGETFICELSEDGTNTNVDQVEDDGIAYNTNAWHSLAFTFVSGTMLLYTDGAAATSPNTNTNLAETIFQTTQPLYLAGFISGGAILAGLGLQGILGYVLIFDAGLAAEDIAAIHAALKTIMAARGVTLP